MRHLRRLLPAALLAATALIALSAAPALAHAEVVSTAPAAGAALHRAPATVDVRFSEPVQAAPDAIRVLAADGTRVDRGDAAPVPGDAGTLAATLRPGLGRGTYTVAWRITSADSHPVHGAFAFTVGEAPGAAAPLAGADRGADPAVAVLVRVARGVGYAGLALLVGAAGAALLPGTSAGRATLVRQTRAGGIALTLSAAVSLLAQGPYAAGTGLASLLDPDPLAATLSGRTGAAEALRVLLAAGLTLAAADPRVTPVPSPGGRWARPVSYLPFVPLVALAATFAATGHSAAGRYVPLALTADVVHLTAMGLWLGGLVALAALLPGGGPVPPSSALVAAVRLFSRLAGWCVVVLVATGTVLLLRQVDSADDLPSTGWGRYLLVKLAVIVVLLAVARRARAWTRRHAPGRGAGFAPAALRSMRRTLAVEAAIGAVVLTLSVLLAGSSPPSDRAVRPSAVTRGAAYDTGGPGGSGTATAVLTPRPDGSTAVDLTLTAAGDTPARPAEFTAAVSLPARDVGPLALDLESVGPGHWTASTTLAPKGAWRLVLTIRTSDIDGTTVTVPVTGP
ncbi:Copper transport protein YcnJ [Streptomyces sp. RB5]|uniref:Copper transport protein YcnJ n=1 Tax=Streptomyces smaragdinus TaxID=2585196 RepID=A0A7K0CHJ0_9ACTN|nr:copper resistance protein CopC [Streptomyces smaragdinus]MQY12928.1 Copper transport protein YcnJ [Streptomyces smaragdinus]